MGKKNSQIHLMLETSFKQRLKEEAINEGVSTSELCRQRLREISIFQRIERLLDGLEHALKNPPLKLPMINRRFNN